MNTRPTVTTSITAVRRVAGSAYNPASVGTSSGWPLPDTLPNSNVNNTTVTTTITQYAEQTTPYPEPASLGSGLAGLSEIAKYVELSQEIAEQLFMHNSMLTKPPMTKRMRISAKKSLTKGFEILLPQSMAKNVIEALKFPTLIRLKSSLDDSSDLIDSLVDHMSGPNIIWEGQEAKRIELALDTVRSMSHIPSTITEVAN